jgi:hypothetical protein
VTADRRRPEAADIRPPSWQGWLRSTAAVFGVLCLGNAFFYWSFPAWFGIFGPPDGLVSPGVDKWVITPLAMAIYFLQLPSYAILYNVKPFSNLHAPATVVVASLFSMAIYLPPVLWLRGRRMRHRAA